MRPCRHCGEPIGLKEPACPRCGREQTATVGLTAAPLADNDGSELSEVDAADDDDAMFYTACRVAPMLTMCVGGVLGYLAAGITGMMVGALVLALAAGVVLATVLGGFG